MEPFHRYNNFHNEVNLTLKVLSGSAKHTAKYLRSPGCTERLGDLIIAADPSWNKPPLWTYEPETEDRIVGQIGNFGVFSVFSAADDFADGIEAEVARWEDFSGGKVAVRNAQSEYRLMRLIQRHGFNTTGIDNDLTVTEYFQTVRNCLAHRDGRASPSLSALSKLPEMAAAYSSFTRRASKELHVFTVDEKISIHPKVAIFYSYITRRIAMSVDRQLLDLVGEPGFINMAVAHVFSKERPIRSHAYKSPEAVINSALTGRYRASSVGSNADTVKMLRKIGLWQRCRDGFDLHYGH